MDRLVEFPSPRPTSEVSSSTPISTARRLLAYATGTKAIAAVIAVTIFSTYFPVVRGRYAFSDDYPLLFIYDKGGTSAWFGDATKYYVTAGRPISAFLYDIAYSAAGTIDNLRFIRLLAVAGIAALAILLHWALVRAGVRSFVAASVALFICTLPSFQVIASWAVLFVAPYAALLGAAGSLLVESALRARDRVILRLVSASAVLFAALLVYQPAAMFFWVFLAIALVRSSCDPVRGRSLARAHLIVGGATLAVAFLSTKVAMHLLGGAAPNAGRSALTHDPIGKLRWFLGDPLYQSLNLFHLTLVPWLAALVAAVAFGGGILLLWIDGRAPLILGLALTIVPLSFLPGLLVAENSATYRIEISLAALIGLYACLGALGLWLTARRWLESRNQMRATPILQRSAPAIAFIVVAACAASAARNVQTYMVHPQQVELGMLRHEVATLPDRVTRVGYVRPSRGPTNRYFSDELGVPSSVRPWSPRPAVLLVLAEERRLPAKGERPTVDVFPANGPKLPRDEPVVDLRALPHER
jgi:hypothetical protein